MSDADLHGMQYEQWYERLRARQEEDEHQPDREDDDGEERPIEGNQ